MIFTRRLLQVIKFCKYLLTALSLLSIHRVHDLSRKIFIIHLYFRSKQAAGKKSEAKGVKFFCLTDNVVSKIWFTI